MSGQDEITEYQGSPEEVGAQLFADALGPTIQAAGQGNVTDEQIARMLAGMMAALAGTVADNYGPDAAIDMLRGTAANIEKAKAAGQMAVPH